MEGPPPGILSFRPTYSSWLNLVEEDLFRHGAEQGRGPRRISFQVRSCSQAPRFFDKFNREGKRFQMDQDAQIPYYGHLNSVRH